MQRKRNINNQKTKQNTGKKQAQRAHPFCGSAKFLAIKDLPLSSRFSFTLSSAANCAASTVKCETAIPLGQPFHDNSGTRKYPPMYEDLTDIWLRYRVISVDMKVNFYPSVGTTSLIGAIYPYRVAASSITDLDGILNATGMIHKPIHYATGAPMVLHKHFNMRECYTLLNDSTENGLEGPATWANATHQWNKQPTYTPFGIIGVYNYANLPGPMNVRFVVETTFNVELTERAPYNTSSITSDVPVYPTLQPSKQKKWDARAEAIEDTTCDCCNI